MIRFMDCHITQHDHSELGLRVCEKDRDECACVDLCNTFVQSPDYGSTVSVQSDETEHFSNR